MSLKDRSRQNDVMLPSAGSETASQIDLSVVAPFMDEAECLPDFCSALRDQLDAMNLDYEVILVDDGSSDGSISTLRKIDWPECRVLRLAQNSGHQNALDAGLTNAGGNWVVTMDSDLQHPPNLIPEMFRLAGKTEAHVVTAVRQDRSEDRLFKRISASAFYSVASFLSGAEVIMNAADFRLMSRRAVDLVNSVSGEKVLRLLVPSLGLEQVEIGFRAAPRFAGSTKYSTLKMVGLALDSSVTFSSALLRAVSLLGLVASGLALVWLVVVLVAAIAGSTIPGWTSVMSVLLIFGGLGLFTLGLLGEYLARIFDVLQGKPNYVVTEEIRLGQSRHPPEI